MSEDHHAEEQRPEEQNEAIGQNDQGDGDYEEISSDEVDRVVTGLDVLIQTVESENIQVILEEALENVYHLVYEDEEDDTVEPLSEAA